MSLTLLLGLLELILKHNTDHEVRRLSFSGPVQKQMAECSRRRRNQIWDSFNASITPSESASRNLYTAREREAQRGFENHSQGEQVSVSTMTTVLHCVTASTSVNRLRPYYQAALYQLILITEDKGFVSAFKSTKRGT